MTNVNVCFFQLMKKEREHSRNNRNYCSTHRISRTDSSFRSAFPQVLFDRPAAVQRSCSAGPGLSAAGAAQRVFDLLELEPDIPLRGGARVDPSSFQGAVHFEDVQNAALLNSHTFLI